MADTLPSFNPGILLVLEGIEAIIFGEYAL